MQPIIVTEDLTIKYGKFTAVNKVSFNVYKGEVFGFLGPNGSGKTTLIKTLCGLHEPAEGRAMIFGLDVYEDTDEIKERIGYMSQRFSLYGELTVQENIDFYAGIYGLRGAYQKQRKEDVIAILGLEQFLQRPANKLSGGWKQRLALACAIIHEPELVFLDEPTAGIDPVARRELWDLLFKLAGQGFTFFVTTHYMDEAERCGRLAYIYYSKLIACGTLDEMRMMPEVTPAGTVRLEVLCQSPSAALTFVKGLSYVIDSTIFGRAIHVLMDVNRPVEMLLSDLAMAGFGKAEVRPIFASLEDVFVRITTHLSKKGAEKK